MSWNHFFINFFFSFLLNPQRPHHAHALFDFNPHHPSQLRFLRGDVIELLDCSDSVRWRGRCHGHVGYFPPEYVQPIYHCQWPDASIEHVHQRTPALHAAPLFLHLPNNFLRSCNWTAQYVTDSSHFPCDATCQSQASSNQLLRAHHSQLHFSLKTCKINKWINIWT